jgi:hypothetical protein
MDAADRFVAVGQGLIKGFSLRGNPEHAASGGKPLSVWAARGCGMKHREASNLFRKRQTAYF